MTTKPFNKDDYKKEANVSEEIKELLTQVGYFEGNSDTTWEFVKLWLLTTYNVYFSQLTYDEEWTYTFTDIENETNIVSKTYRSYEICRREAFKYTLRFIINNRFKLSRTY